MPEDRDTYEGSILEALATLRTDRVQEVQSERNTMEFADIEHPPSHWKNIRDNRSSWHTVKEGYLRLNLRSSIWFCDPFFLEEYGLTTAGDLLDLLVERGIPEDTHLQGTLAQSPFFKSVEDNPRSLYLEGDYTPVLTCPRDHKLLKVVLDDYRPRTQRTTDYVLFCGETPDEDQWHYRWEDSWSDGVQIILCLTKRSGVEGNPRGEVQRYNYIPDYVKRCLGPKDQDEYFGIEIEMSSEVSAPEMYRILTEMEPKQDPFLYFKHDSSIHQSMEYTYEMVSHPCTMRYLRKNLRIFFQKLEDLAELKGVKLSEVVDTQIRESNGFHVHIDKGVFRSKNKHGVLASGWRNRFASILNLWDKKSVSLLTALSRRSRNIDDNHFCKPHARMRNRTLSHRINWGPRNEIYEDRYAACRYTDYTVEVRLFQGHFNLEHILYCLQVVEAMLKFSREAPLSAINMRFSRFFKNWLAKQNRFVSVRKEIL